MPDGELQRHELPTTSSGGGAGLVARGVDKLQSSQSSSRRQRLSRLERQRLKKRERRRQQVHRAKTFCKRFMAFAFSHIGLSCLIVAYIFVGGMLFQAIEMPHERKLKAQIRQFKNDTLANFLSQQLRLLCPDQEAAGNWSSDGSCLASSTATGLQQLANDTLMQVFANVTKYVKEDGWNGSLQEQDYNWNFAGALLFVVTIITTIGYGHAVPKTLEGMLATMACAFFGIPLMFLYLNNIGDYLADGFRFLYSNTCRPYLKRIRLCAESQSDVAFIKAHPDSLVCQQPGRSEFDIVRVKTDFAKPLTRAVSEAAGEAASDVRNGHRDALGWRPKRDLLFDGLPGSELDCTEKGARKAFITARVLPATGGRIRRPAILIRSQSAPEPQPVKSSQRAPVIDWATIDQDLSAGANETITALRQPDDSMLSRRISYLSLPSPAIAATDASFTSTSASSSLTLDDAAWEDACMFQGIAGIDSGVSVAVAAAAAVAVPSDLGVGSSDFRVRRHQRDLQQRLKRLRELSTGPRLRQVTVPLSLSVSLMVGYVVLGSFLFTIWEKRDYVKWSYFCFITLSTIGFGDIVPGTEIDSKNPKEKLIATCLYVAVGLSVFAMCFKLMQEEAIQKVRRLGRRLGIIKRREADFRVKPAVRRSRQQSSHRGSSSSRRVALKRVSHNPNRNSSVKFYA